MFWTAGAQSELEADDGLLSYALELEKSLKTVAESAAAAPDDAARQTQATVTALQTRTIRESKIENRKSGAHGE